MEIIGKQLDKAMEELNIKATKTYQGTGESPFQVWSVNDEDYNRLLAIGEDQWEHDFGWWRAGGCIFEGQANVEFAVNGEKMMGYNEGSYKSYEDYDDMEPDTDFNSFEEWFYESMGLGKETNMAIFAESLAKDNGLTLTEFMTKYQG